jgi:hypothetical protein
VNNPLAELFDQFLKERTYLQNVTPKTLVWYQVAFKSYRGTILDETVTDPARRVNGELQIIRHFLGLREVPIRSADGVESRPCAVQIGPTERSNIHSLSYLMRRNLRRNR